MSGISWAAGHRALWRTWPSLSQISTLLLELQAARSYPFPEPAALGEGLTQDWAPGSLVFKRKCRFVEASLPLLWRSWAGRESRRTEGLLQRSCEQKVLLHSRQRLLSCLCLGAGLCSRAGRRLRHTAQCVPPGGSRPSFPVGQALLWKPEGWGDGEHGGRGGLQGLCDEAGRGPTLQKAMRPNNCSMGSKGYCKPCQ